MKKKRNNGRQKRYLNMLMLLVLFLFCTGCVKKEKRQEDFQTDRTEKAADMGCDNAEKEKDKINAGEDGQKTENMAEQKAQTDQKDFDLSGQKIGICMPGVPQERWTADAEHIKKLLEEMGCEVITEFADSAVKQNEQIGNLIGQKVNLLIIAPVDSDGLAEILNKAADQAVFVISYDEVLMNTDAVDYYVMFNHYQAGRMQGEYIAEWFSAEKEKKKEMQLPPVQVTGADGTKLSAKAMYQGLEDELLLSMEEEPFSLSQTTQETDEKITVRQNWMQEDEKKSENTILRVDLCRQYDQKPVPDAGDMIVYQNTAKEAETTAIVARTMLCGGDIESVAESLQEQKIECFYNTKSYDNGTGLIPGFLISSEPVKD